MSTIPSTLTAKEIEVLTGVSKTTVMRPSTSSSGTGLLKALSPTLPPYYTPIGMRQRTISELIEGGYWVKMTGSRVTKDGWTDESDWDYVVYDPDKKLQDVYKQQDGWVLGSEAEQGEFSSIKKDGINLILVDKEEIWKKYIIATNLIKTLNSKTKEERIAVFDSVFGKDKNAAAVDFGVPF